MSDQELNSSVRDLITAIDKLRGSVDQLTETVKGQASEDHAKMREGAAEKGINQKRGRVIERLLPVEEAPKILRMHSKTYYHLAKAGLIPAVKIGQKWMMSPTALEEFLKRKQVKSRLKDYSRK